MRDDRRPTSTEPAPVPGRPPVSFLAWGPVTGRSREIAEALGGEARCFYPLRIVRRTLVPLRYALSALQTLGYLARRRPAAVIVTNPPIFPALICAAYARLTACPLVLDSHPDAFRTDGPHARFLGLHARLARRARATLVTTDELAGQVRAWGGDALVVHEAPPRTTLTPSPPNGARPTVLVLGSLSVDELVEEALEAAGSYPDADFHFTGDPRRCPPELVASAPQNVRFLGYLDEEGYTRALAGATVTVVLTTWLRYAVPRSAYDAVYARRPLVLSDSPTLRTLFPFAVFVEGTSSSIAEGVSDALERRAELEGATAEAHAAQLERWATQLRGLRAAIETTPGERERELGVT